MIVQKSKDSEIYHRIGCQYIGRIREDALQTFDMEDIRKRGLKPCKCCCSIGAIYREYAPRLDERLKSIDAQAELKDGAISVITPSYRWHIEYEPHCGEFILCEETGCEGIRSEDASDKDTSSEDTTSKDTNCKDSGSEDTGSEEKNVEDIRSKNASNEMARLENIDEVISFIAREERLAEYPSQYRKFAFKINRYAKENNIQIQYEGTDLYIITDIAAWKIAYGYRADRFKLLHCPFNGNPFTIEEARTAHYHVQHDVEKDQSPYKHLKYIVKHDIAKKIEQDDYRKLPTKTKMQKRYYKQAENRAIRKSIKNVFDIFAELETEKNFVKLSIR